MTERAVLSEGDTVGDNLHVKQAYRNLTVPQLVEAALKRGEAVLSATGAVVATTGARTGRSADDKFVVETPAAASMHWTKFHKAMQPETYAAIKAKALAHMAEREMFVLDASAGADPAYALPIRVVTEYAWHNLFAKQLFRDAISNDQQPQWTVLNLPSLKLDPAVDGSRSEVAAMINLDEKLILIVGTEYAGEIKKSIFTVLNMVLPSQDVMPMHCSANIGSKGDVALFFGLSGTGKTTLSADPERVLIGDDEHGWSANGVFNFEGGCYAKCIRLRRESEPEIFDAIRYGAVLENVVLSDSRDPNYDDASLTENTRAAYPLEFIPNVSETGMGGQPETIIFLTADAFGVLPPIAKLSPEQAMYHFLSGYTAKLAGTETGIGSEPQATFSTCFGAPFMPLHPTVYADLLGQKMREHKVRVFLVNTGWTGGAFGVGKRMSLRDTRTMVHAALEGKLDNVEMWHDDRFNLDVPVAIDGVDNSVLQPRQTWADASEYDRVADDLAARFRKNFEQYAERAGETVVNAGPQA
ncbi:phosphoenolpyruvate carboxykinase (ATP) [Herpetosiphon llansteffanensis]|uniref:phosphoenolpyruvate carboxykinase (ATP) n=1 Tax=Herpetosiphon llansteffanensis TaxID=2094568 RepID=UPI000D7CEAF4|nr:phosphoenolpyruvate carboxykinase (ATP) [Herpetosiphon llansteffanensis]